MATKRRRGKLEDVQLEMTPMIDIVFNLLIFFMCATKFRTVEGMIAAHLPKDRGQGTSTADVDLNEVRVKLLWHDGAGRPTHSREAGRVVLKLGEEALNAPGELEACAQPALAPVWRTLHERLRALKAAYPGSNPDGLPVIIDAREQVPTQFVVSALNEVVRADIREVSFAMPELPF